MNVLMLHVPKLEDFYLPFGRYMNVNYMPVGFVGIANLLADNGHDSRIIHAGIKKIQNAAWKIAEEIKTMDVQAVGMGLHWHYQAYDVVMAAKRIKEVRPDIHVFLGGITASFFARQIIEDVPEVDSVIAGEGYAPALQLMEALSQKSALSDVDNLVFRNSGSIVENPRKLYPQQSFEHIEFADLSRLEDSEFYIQQFGFPLAYSLERSSQENRQSMTMGRSFFPLFVGSGCNTSCSYCGGNARTQTQINGTHRILFRSHDKVISDVRSALKQGYRTMALCFDPPPDSTAYYVELFRRMKQETPAADLYFEAWGLPDRPFIDAFADAFSPPHSYVALSPDTGNEELRRRNKGHYYSNQELLDICDYLEHKNVQMDLFFSIGFPGETVEKALQTRELIRKMAQRHNNIRRLMTWAVQMEPGSPQFLEPEKWGIETPRRRFMDFVRLHGERGDAYAVLGYRIPGFFSDERDKGSIQEFERHFQRFKCENFCFLSKDPGVYNEPALGRQVCLERRQDLAVRRAMVPPDTPIGRANDYFDCLEREHPQTPRMEI